MDGQRVAPPPMQKPSSLVEQVSVGQKVEGKVTRVTEFGAFVDIGIGRDGMIHISELRTGRVQKVSDVVQEGQHVAVWVKDVDSKKNRISLTMVDPNRKKIRDLVPGSTVQGTVMRLAPYGAFIDIGVEREGMLHVKEMGEGFIKDPADVVRPGDTVSVRILTVDPQRLRVDLSMKPEEPAAPLTHRDRDTRVVVDEPVILADTDDAPTYMEEAMQRAMERREKRERKERKRRERLDYRDEQEEILSRTLERHRDGH